LTVRAAGRPIEAVLRDLVRPVYDIEADDGRLRAGAVTDDKDRAAHFDGLRKRYPMRREFRFTRVAIPDSPALAAQAAALGFQV
jgi:erythronate-4-phosphate dehydrogenase